MKTPKRFVKSEDLLLEIGKIWKRVKLVEPYGNGSIHMKGWIVADPCYIEYAISRTHENTTIRNAIVKCWPWDARDPEKHHRFWTPFKLDHPEGELDCYFRSMSDGYGDFGNEVDSGCMVAIPLVFLPQPLLKSFRPIDAKILENIHPKAKVTYVKA